jgi:hypothetical protein
VLFALFFNQRGLSCAVQSVVVFLKNAYLDFTAVSGDIHAVRRLYRRLVFFPREGIFSSRRQFPAFSQAFQVVQILIYVPRFNQCYSEWNRPNLLWNQQLLLFRISVSPLVLFSLPVNLVLCFLLAQFENVQFK